MVFVMGPRQVGKTTVAQSMVDTWPEARYISWDNISDRELILQGPRAIAASLSLDTLRDGHPLIAFDELHKFPKWRDFLKGLYDSYPNLRLVVTGSGKLDVFNRGGDSLMGRYFPFRFHPLSVAEVVHDRFYSEGEIRDPKPIDPQYFTDLWEFGGYPDPFLKRSAIFARRWQRLRLQQLLQGDVRDLTQVQDTDTMELLAQYLVHHAGDLLSYQSLAKKLRVSDKTVKHWLSVLKSLYYCFAVKPWSTNVARSLLKEPKYYLWDWSLCFDEGSRAENFIASHLLKAVHYWTDMGFGDYQLHFLRDTNKREVDFLVSKDNQPWLLLEVKYGQKSSLSSSLLHFQEQIKPRYTLQVSIELPYVNKSCFQSERAIIVPARTLLSQLV